MKKPKKLKQNDTVSLVSPSSPINKESVFFAKNILEKHGLIVHVKPCCYSNISYLSGTDFLRAKSINESFLDKNIKGIFCIRGGYGAQRILDFLDYTAISKNPKIFSGYSDVTALHIAFNQKCDFATYHSPMLGTTFLRSNLDETTKKSFFENIFEKENLNDQKNFSTYNLSALTRGYAKGIFTGGNLSVIAASIGTEYEIETKNKILFLEEVDEDIYKIDRMLTQLRLSKKLDFCAGIVFGQFINCACNPKYSTFKFEDLIKNIIKPLKIPVLYNFDCGHGMPNITIQLGFEAIINQSKLIVPR